MHRCQFKQCNRAPRKINFTRKFAEIERNMINLKLWTGNTTSATQQIPLYDSQKSWLCSVVFNFFMTATTCA
jgi:hypothetical protein